MMGAKTIYRPDIDGLRAIAILLVLFFHGGFRQLSGGFVGVDIFFVISGFLITGIILRETNTVGFSFVDFYSRRIRRICPALFLVLTLSIIAALFLLVPQDLQLLGRSLGGAVFFYANWHFYNQVGYFDGPATEKPLLHTWSLAVEEQFYLVWPLLFIALYHFVGRKALPHVILALLCLSLVASQYILQKDAAAAFYLLPYRAWELLLGAYIAFFYTQARSKMIATSFGVLGVAAIAYAAVFFNAATPFPGIHSLIPCAGAALLIFAGQRSNIVSSFVLGAKPLRFIGKISYSLYLIHWPLFSLTRMTLDRDTTQVEGLIIIAVSVVAATLSWHFVEFPARRTVISFPALAGVTASAMLAIGLCGSLFNITQGLPFRVSEGIVQADAARDAGHKGDGECRAVKAPVSIGCAIGSLPHDDEYDFVIWGDSHARHLALAFSEQAAKRGLAGIIVWNAGCGPFLHDARLSPNCAEANNQTERWIKTQENLKLVFLAGYWASYTNRFLSVTVDDGSSTGQNRKDGPTGIGDTLRFLQSRNLQAVIVEDIPVFSRNVGLCTARARMFSQPEERCYTLAMSEYERSEREASEILHRVSQRFGIPLLNTARAFCDRDACRVERNGVIFYSDSNHLNRAGAKYLGSVLRIPWPDADLKGAGLEQGASAPRGKS